MPNEDFDYKIELFEGRPVVEFPDDSKIENLKIVQFYMLHRIMLLLEATLTPPRMVSNAMSPELTLALKNTRPSQSIRVTESGELHPLEPKEARHQPDDPE